MICAKGMPDNTPWQLRAIGGDRHMCSKERGHEGPCGEWQWVSQPQHAHALATGEDPFRECVERLTNLVLKEKQVTVRAKFTVQSVTRIKLYDGTEGQTIRLTPVTGGSDENKDFYKYTPGGAVELMTVNKTAGDYFELGEAYYLDFTKAG